MILGPGHFAGNVDILRTCSTHLRPQCIMYMYHPLKVTVYYVHVTHHRPQCITFSTNLRPQCICRCTTHLRPQCIMYMYHPLKATVYYM